MNDLIVPAHIFNDSAFSPAQRLFLAKITQLCQASGSNSTKASNIKLAQMFQVSEDTITAWVGVLKSRGAITVEYNGVNKARRIYLGTDYKPKQPVYRHTKLELEQMPGRRLTLTARILLSELVKLSKGWEVTSTDLDLVDQTRLGLNTLKRRLRELRVKGCIKTEVYKLPNGRRRRKIIILKEKV